MELDQVLSTIIRPTWAQVLPARFVSPEAEVMLLAIGYHESHFIHREQIRGPARGFWQFEQRGGTAGVLNHHSSRAYAAATCMIQGVAATAAAVQGKLASDDLLACAFARLLLWTDPRPLPALGNADAAFNCYLRNWRPGAWDRGSPEQRADLRRRWDDGYRQAYETVT